MEGSAKGPLSYVKRGLASLFVCGVVLFPVFTAVNWAVGLAKDGNTASSNDSRTVIRMPAFKQRQVDAATLKPFEEPIITITFDDGWESIYTDAVPILQEYGIRSTQYVLAGVFEDQKYMSKEQIVSMRNAGQEIGCHGMKHPNLRQSDQATILYELSGCKSTLESLLGSPVRDYASPYGSFDDRVVSEISKVFRSHRTTQGDITNGVYDIDVNLGGFNAQRIISFVVKNDTKMDDIKAAIEYTKERKGWLILTYHQAEDGSPYGLDTVKLKEQLGYIKDQPVKIAPVGEVLDMIEYQEANDDNAPAAP